FRPLSYHRLVDGLVKVAKEAIAARRPAKIGVAVDQNFDPTNLVSHDRRGENDQLAGGSFKDSFLAVIRVDAADGQPIAALATFGVHGTTMDDDNPLMTGDSPGAIERALEESFDGKVVSIHFQGAAGDVSPSGS